MPTKKYLLLVRCSVTASNQLRAARDR